MLIFDESWHAGVVGIVAGKLKDRFNRPAFVGCIEPESGRGKASGRSIPGLNLAAMIQNYPLIVSGGGHAMAAGIAFDVENIDTISKAFNQYVSQFLKAEDFIPAIELTADVEGEALSRIANIIEHGPFSTHVRHADFLVRVGVSAMFDGVHEDFAKGGVELA